MATTDTHTSGTPVAHALLDVLRDWGVRHVFCCPGSTEAAFLDATLDRPELDLVLTTAESATVAMAEGYARVTGRPAVATGGLPVLVCVIALLGAALAGLAGGRVRFRRGS